MVDVSVAASDAPPLRTCADGNPVSVRSAMPHFAVFTRRHGLFILLLPSAEMRKARKPEKAEGRKESEA
jgi:hypothetical protein